MGAIKKKGVKGKSVPLKKRDNKEMSCCTSWPREADPTLHDLYARKLLIPGWAGVLTWEEAEYIRANLEANPTLRRKWRIKGKGRIPLTKIAERAYPEDPQAARHHIQKEQARAQRRIHSQAKNDVSKPRRDKATVVA